MKIQNPYRQLGTNKNIDNFGDGIKELKPEGRKFIKRTTSKMIRKDGKNKIKGGE